MAELKNHIMLRRAARIVNPPAHLAIHNIGFVHPLRHSITRDKAHDDQTKQLGNRITAEVAQHRAEKTVAAKTNRRIEKLASALGVAVSKTTASPARTTQKEEALQRMKQRQAALDTVTEDQQ